MSTNRNDFWHLIEIYLRVLFCIDSQSFQDITLNLIAVSTGVYTVQGLSLYDSLTKKSHPLKPLPSVVVISHPDGF